jgi:hypothetical protein
MPPKPLEKLRELAARIQNLPTTDDGATHLRELVNEAESLLSALEAQRSSSVSYAA